MTLRRGPATCALGALMLLAAACGDDATGPQTGTGTVAGTVTDLAGDRPLAGATVLIVDDAFAVLQAVRSDGDGRFTFAQVPPGSCLLYALDAHFAMADPAVSRLTVSPGRTVTVPVGMLPHEELEEPLWRIEGRVTDAATGAPVAGAWIASTGYGEAGNSVRYITENRGIEIAVSDADGRYFLRKSPVREFYPDGPVIGLGTVSCAAAGYRPRTFAGAGPDFSWEPAYAGGLLPAPADSVLALDIALVARPAGGLPAAAVGTLRGRVVHDGLPQADVMVTTTLLTLAARDTVLDPDAKVAVADASARSGADGTFEFALEPGFYALRAGLLPDDGWCRAGGWSSLEIVAGEVFEAGDVAVGPAITPVSPAPGAVVSGALPVLSWTPIAGAEHYVVQIGVGSFGMQDLGTTTGTSFDPYGKLALPPEPTVVRWQVRAVRVVDPPYTESFSWFEVPASFTVAGTPAR